MGLMDILFGGDGIGGQPGAVGSAVNAVGSAGADAAKTLAKLPLTLATLPTDFLKNPAVFFGDGPRGIDLAAVFDKDYRKTKEADIKAQREFDTFIQQARGFKAGDELLADIFGRPGIQGPQGVEQAVAIGIPQDRAERAGMDEVAAELRAEAGRADLLSAGVPAPIASRVGGTEEDKAVADMLFKVEADKRVEERAKARDAAIAARAAARASGVKQTDAEKKLDAYNRAVASRDPVAIAATRAALEAIGKSSQPMVVTRPDGSVVVGPAGEVAAFGSQTAKDRALATIDANDALLATIQDARAIAERAPEAFGATGSAAGMAQNLTAQSKAFQALQDRVRGDVAAGGFEPEASTKIVESFISEIPTLNAIEMTLAAAKARAMNPDGKISDADFNNALRIVRGGSDSNGWLANAESFKAVLTQLEKESNREITRAKMRAGNSEKTRNPISAAIAAKDGQPEEKRKKKAKAKGKLGTMSDEELLKLNTMDDIDKINELNDRNFKRWKELTQGGR